MGEHLEKDMTEYRELLDKSIDYMENQLYDGEYFIQNIRWKELQASDPTKVQSVNSNYWIYWKRKGRNINTEKAVYLME